MSTLVVKLAATFVKQLSKPMAKILTSYVMSKPDLRKSIVSLSQVGALATVAVARACEAFPTLESTHTCKLPLVRKIA